MILKTYEPTQLWLRSKKFATQNMLSDITLTSDDFTEHEICRNVLFYYETLRTLEQHDDIE